ncbi:hypothetical protein QLS71_017300 [Mariniflexile litorale]|uniref:Adhesin domain-containing protein n=1 Tax=Mariniflexile litorale TaxID=3045158 RepID=A0AAU7EGP6_9FLAO|nr:hypothetical protein [Mariniflexile sp. KMM 9835]MDQ8211603.1 hypothetical protein [Mariniflexile sp. KMM 9835]
MNKSIIKVTLFVLSFFVAGSLFSQQKLTKTTQSIDVNKDVTINLNTSYTNIVFDTWNKNTIEIEAYIEGEKLSGDALKKALKDWKITVDASKSIVTISTKGGDSNVWSHNFTGHDNDAVHAVLKELKFELADLPELPELPAMPDVPKIPEMPELPNLPEGISKMQFNYEAYQKDGEKYLKEYSKKFESSFGKEYAKKMEAWGEKFGEEWGEKYGKEMEAWAKKFEGKWEEKYGKEMEAWGEEFAKRMEQQTERIAHQQERLAVEREKQAQIRENHMHEREKLADERRVLIEKMVSEKSNTNVKKTIKIKMPKGAKLKVNVRHGEIEFAANIDNLKADLAYTKFTAQSINGSKTSINASYSPINVTYWNLGKLNLNYAKNVKLSNVKQLVLNSNSSNITIKNLLGSAVINGNIGDLKVLKIDDAFTNLNVILQNSNATISLPKADYNLQYNGNQSRFSHPKKTSKDTSTTFSIGSLSSGKSIVVNAKYSHVIMQ